MSSLVFIIIINYKGLSHTIECLESLERITYSNYKIIVIDNNSEDHCSSIINEKFEQVITIDNKENLGFAVANNIGIQYALSNKADFVLMLNNDTIVQTDFLDILVEEYMKCIDKKVGITVSKVLNYYEPEIISYAGGNINYFKGSSDIIGLGEIDNNQYDYNDKITFATGCCMLIGAEAIKEVGLLDDGYFLYYEDTDYSIKLIEKDYKIIFCPNSIIYHKESASTVHASNVYTYYFCRNRLFFIHNNFKLQKRFIPYIYSILQIGKKILLQHFGLKYTIIGIYDFLRRKKGRNEFVSN